MAASEFRAVNLRHNVEWLRGLRREMDLVFAAAKSRRFPTRSVITFQGDPADRFLLMWDGRARYFFETPSGKKVILMWIAPGDIFGAAALVSRPSSYLTSTEAVRDSVVLVWERSAIRARARRFAQLLENTLLFATDYFRRAGQLGEYHSLHHEPHDQQLAAKWRDSQAPGKNPSPLS